MNILLIYGTNSGGTQAASGTVEEKLKSLGHNVSVKEVLEVNVEEVGTHDITILGSCSWDYNGLEGQPHEHFVTFLPKIEGKLKGKKVAIFALGDSSYTVFCGAADELLKFAQKEEAVIIGQPLKIDGYFFHTAEATEALTAWASTVGS